MKEIQNFVEWLKKNEIVYPKEYFDLFIALYSEFEIEAQGYK